MKKFILFLIGGIIGNVVFSQNINVAQHTASDYASSIVSIHAKSYYLEKVQHSCLYNTFNVVALNDSGKIILKKNFAFTENNTPLKLIKTADKQLAFIGQSISGDVGTNANYKNYLIKLDTNGVISFQTFIQNFYTISGVLLLEGIKDFVQHADSSYYLISDSLLHHYSKTGQFISKVNTGFTKLNSITALYSNHLLLNGISNNNLKNQEISTTYSVINEQTANSAILKFAQTNSGKLIGKTTNNSLEMYDANLQSITNSTITFNSNIRFNDFVIYNDSLFTTGVNSPINTPFYKILDTNFIVLYQTINTNYKQVFPSGITLNNKHKINILTNCTSTINTNISFTSLYQLPVTGSFFSSSNIGVASFSAITASAAVSFSYGQYSTVNPTFNIAVKIKNFEADTVKSFYLNHYINRGYYCWELFHKKYLVTILPYDSVVVQTGTIYGAEYTAINVQNNSIFYPTLCFFTSVPNFENDIEISNDANCDSIPVSISIVGVNELEIKDEKLKVYPNPFTNKVILEFENEATINSKLTISNTLGQIVCTIKEVLPKQELDLSFLNSGIYYLNIKSNAGQKTSKMIKE
jgi:hypothetical protein